MDYSDDDGDVADLNKVKSIVGSWMKSQYATEQPSCPPQANMPIWPGRYGPNMPIQVHECDIFQNILSADIGPPSKPVPPTAHRLICQYGQVDIGQTQIFRYRSMKIEGDILC